MAFDAEKKSCAYSESEDGHHLGPDYSGRFPYGVVATHRALTADDERRMDLPVWLAMLNRRAYGDVAEIHESSIRNTGAKFRVLIVAQIALGEWAGGWIASFFGPGCPGIPLTFYPPNGPKS